jgi:hypothetical protein
MARAQSLTMIAMARARLDKLLPKIQGLDFDETLEAATDAALKAVFAAETLRDMTSSRLSAITHLSVYMSYASPHSLCAPEDVVVLNWWCCENGIVIYT